MLRGSLFCVLYNTLLPLVESIFIEIKFSSHSSGKLSQVLPGELTDSARTSFGLGEGGLHSVGGGDHDDQRAPPGNGSFDFALHGISVESPQYSGNWYSGSSEIIEDGQFLSTVSIEPLEVAIEGPPSAPAFPFL